MRAAHGAFRSLSPAGMMAALGLAAIIGMADGTMADTVHKARVAFAKGSTGTRLSGKVKGRDTMEYLVGAGDGQHMLARVETEKSLPVAMADRQRGDHLGIEQRMARHLAVEHAAMPVRPVHHGSHREAAAAEIRSFFHTGQLLTCSSHTVSRSRM